MKCGSKLLKSKLFKLAPLDGILPGVKSTESRLQSSNSIKNWLRIIINRTHRCKIISTINITSDDIADNLHLQIERNSRHCYCQRRSALV